jgi:hypothetical protein
MVRKPTRRLLRDLSYTSVQASLDASEATAEEEWDEATMEREEMEVEETEGEERAVGGAGVSRDVSGEGMQASRIRQLDPSLAFPYNQRLAVKGLSFPV